MPARLAEASSRLPVSLIFDSALCGSSCRLYQEKKNSHPSALHVLFPLEVHGVKFGDHAA